MQTLKDFKPLVGQIISATSANTYEIITGKCVAARETVTSYTDITRGIDYLVDIENAGCVKVGLAKTAKVLNKQFDAPK